MAPFLIISKEKNIISLLHLVGSVFLSAKQLV